MSLLRVASMGLGLVLALAGCASRAPVREAAPVDRAAAQAEESQRAALQDWSLGGRIAVSSGGRGGSGRIDWQQRASSYTISLSAPVTRQSWRLSGDAAGARLEGVSGGPREGNDVEELLHSATGWTIPVRALQDWVRGVEAPSADYGPAKRVYDGAGLPARLEQAGWAIDYLDWYPADTGAPRLPKRIAAKNGDACVKLVIDAWEPLPR